MPMDVAAEGVEVTTAAGATGPASGSGRPSVVIASCRDRALLSRAVDAVRAQVEAHGAELVIVRAGGAADVAAVRERCPNARVVSAPLDAGIPRLRGLGLAAAVGDPVAMTEDHCVPAPDWLDRLLVHTRRGVHVVGGGMANRPGTGPVAWGAYLADYGFYSHARPSGTTAVPLMTAANIAYRREVVPEVAEWCGSGAWENVVHDRLAAAGRALHFAPEARMFHDHRYRFREFCRDRYDHGWDYARARLTEDRSARRWLLLPLAAALPPLLLWRIARAAGNEDPWQFLRALPVTTAFLVSWAAGEAAGYWRGPLREGEDAGRVAAT
ncbi:MAG: glycosyltransferase family 2 protein [Gemmatimonadales bacterium]